MNADSEDAKRKQEAEVASLIEEIKLIFERIGYHPAPGLLSQRIEDLKRLPSDRLRQVKQDLEQSEAAEATNVIVKAISDYRQTQREDEAKRLDEMVGPAEVEFP